MTWLLIGLAIYLVIGIVLVIIIANTMYAPFILGNLWFTALYIVAYPYFIIRNILDR